MKPKSINSGFTVFFFYILPTFKKPISSKNSHKSMTFHYLSMQNQTISSKNSYFLLSFYLFYEFITDIIIYDWRK